LKIADIQTLFHAIDPTSDLHESAARWLEDAINDAYLAALTVSRGATLASFDQDFERFATTGCAGESPEADPANSQLS
jgi:predicted nucleic acid-binding protein